MYATQHTSEGLNAQVYNRCVGTRYCASNCPYSVRFFNFSEPSWPEPLTSQLNPDVTVRSKGIMEKCTFCVQRINRAKRDAAAAKRTLADGDIQPACAQACPTDALVFRRLERSRQSDQSLVAQDPRRYRLLEDLGTEPVRRVPEKGRPHRVMSSEFQWGVRRGILRLRAVDVAGGAGGGARVAAGQR